MKIKINLMFKKTRFIVFLALLCSTVFAQNARDNWQQPRRVMDSLGVQSGMVIGEVGAGDGYFTWFLAERVGDSGKVYANDIDDDELDKIRRKVLRDSLTNIIPILGETTETSFPEGSRPTSGPSPTSIGSISNPTSSPARFHRSWDPFRI